MIVRILDIVIPTLNEERNLPSCLASIWMQRLPEGVTLRVCIADAGSTDRTPVIASEANVEILDNSLLRDPEAAKMVGLRACGGEFLLFMDADMAFAHESALASMLRPLLDDPEIVAVFGRFLPRTGDPPVNRAISMDPMQCDPLYQALVPSVPTSPGPVKFRGSDIPPIAGTTLYRRAAVVGAIRIDIPRYYDVDVPVALVQAGFRTFFWEPRAAFYHDHASSFRILIRKRLRNLNNGRGNGLLTNQDAPRLYRWIDTNRYGMLGTIARIASAFMGIPLVPGAIGKAVRYRDPAALLLPLIGPVVAWTLTVGLLRDAAGLRYIASALGIKAKRR